MAELKCKKGFIVQVCQSAAGYYMGTKTLEGEPNCRLSDYADSPEMARRLPLSRQFYCIENDFCHGGSGCQIKDFD
jgi:hypothetical protein